jgi:hypothetical protein
MRRLYNFGIFCYKHLVASVSHRNPKAGKLTKGQKEIFPYLEKTLDKNGGYIWIHASSLGEFEQGRPLIETIRRTYPERKILLTFFSPSGYEVRKNYNQADAVCYLPFDLPGNVRRFLDLVKPQSAIFIKYEFWANYLTELKKRDIPTYIISAIFRPKQIFFRFYGGYFRKMLHCFTRLYVQDENSRKLLDSIGVRNVSVVGDTRFDRVVEISNSTDPNPLLEKFVGEKFVWVGGSTWPKDEEIILDYFNRHPEQKLILAPHEIHEEHLQSIIARLKRPYLRYTQATEANVADADCLIIDCFGLLSSLYRYGKLAYIGGGFGVGIHNIAEAAVYSIPVIFGPNYHRFKEAINLIDNGGAFPIHDAASFESTIENFISNREALEQAGKSAGDYIKSHSGATAVIFKEIIGK